MYYVIRKTKFNCKKKPFVLLIVFIKKKFISNYKCNKKKFGIYPKTIKVIETVHNVWPTVIVKNISSQWEVRAAYTARCSKRLLSLYIQFIIKEYCRAHEVIILYRYTNLYKWSKRWVNMTQKIRWRDP